MNTEFINKLLDNAGNTSMRYFKSSDLNVEIKPDDSPVSIADKETEMVIRDLIEQSYPDHGIIGEEYENKNTDAKYTWVIDPIDGTRAFIKGEKNFSNMVVLLQDGVPILSGIGFPALNEQYMGIENKSYCNGNEINVAQCEIDECQLAYTHKNMFNEDEFETVKNIAKLTAGEKVGGDALNFCRMAGGNKLIVMESDLKLYDFLPLVPIIKNAGGQITDWSGSELNVNSGNQVIATPFDNSKILNKI